MEWVDGTVAIGNWWDILNRYERDRNGIYLSMDARNVFQERFFSIGRKPNAEKVARAVEQLLYLAEKEVKVMVHCYHGRDRSPFLVMVYLSRKMGISYEEAFEIVRKGRPRAIFHQDWVEELERTE